MSISGTNQSPGLRFHHQMFPTHRDLGIGYYPYGAIASGLVASASGFAAAAPSATIAARTVAVTAGSAYLDGVLSTLASGVSLSLTAPIASIVAGLNSFDVFLNPTRSLQAKILGNAVPTTLLNGDAIAEGNLYADAYDNGDYLVTSDVYKYINSVWTKYDLTFAPGDLPKQEGMSRLIGNDVVPTLANTNFSLTPEKDIYWSSRTVPYTNSNSLARLRAQCALSIAKLNLYYITLPVSITATFAASTSVTVAAADRATFALIAASVSNTNTLQIDGAALATGGYNAGTGVITLAASYGGTTGSKTVNVTPVTGGNNYIFVPTLSSVVPSTNLTNP